MRAPVVYAPFLTPLHTASVPSASGIIFHPPFRPIRPVIFVYSPSFLVGGPFWPFNACWWQGCDSFWPWTFGYTNVSSPGPVTYAPQVYQTPVYVYGEEREDTPQLYLKDGSVLNVTDYWVVDDQLHFTVIEEPGTKAVEHSIPFDALDVQKSVDANTRRGFRFMLRNEPVEQYVRDHPEGPPPLVVPPHN